MNAPAEKEHAHDLIERLPADRIPTVVRFIEFMLLDPVARSLVAAPMDDEPLSEEEIRAIEASKEWFRHNKGTPHEEVLAEFGLRPEDFPLERGDVNRSR
jgi:hypothetical protein